MNEKSRQQIFAPILHPRRSSALPFALKVTVDALGSKGPLGCAAAYQKRARAFFLRRACGQRCGGSLVNC